MRALLAKLPVLGALLVASPLLAGNDYMGKTPPEVRVGGWLNGTGEAISLESLKGRVVLIEFWATW